MAYLSQEDAAALERRLGKTFQDRALLEQALTHRSYQPASSEQPAPDNRRLQFLGDSVLSVVVAVRLHTLYPEWSQGELDRVRAAVASADTLSQVGRDLGLGELLLMDRGEEETGGRDRPSILADAVQAIIGADFVEAIGPDFARHAAHPIVGKLLRPLLKTIVSVQPDIAEHAFVRELNREAHALLASSGASDEPAPESDPLAVLEARIGHSFRDRSLLEEALTHASYQPPDADRPTRTNGRLAFVGDALLGSIVAMFLYFLHPDWTEGEMTRLRVSAVSSAPLARIGRALGLGDFLRLGRGEEGRGGRDRAAILAGAVEALFGAIYLDVESDAGRQAARSFVLRLVGPRLDALARDPRRADPKNALQQVSQRRVGVQPTYRILRESGPDHDKRFVVEARVGDHVVGVGTGKSRKQAEQEAASRALEQGAQAVLEGIGDQAWK